MCLATHASPLPQFGAAANVARGTTGAAYEQLTGEGYLTARERRGYYLTEDTLIGRATYEPQQPGVTTGSKISTALVD